MDCKIGRLDTAAIVRYNLYMDCIDCGRPGSDSRETGPDSDLCPECSERREIEAEQDDTCDACGGSGGFGTTGDMPCPQCHGNGVAA